MTRPQVTKATMQEKLQGYLAEGFNNQQIADALNEEYDATEQTKVNANFVSKLKAELGMKNTKPKKKSLFELVEEDDVTQVEMETFHERPE